MNSRKMFRDGIHANFPRFSYDARSEDYYTVWRERKIKNRKT